MVKYTVAAFQLIVGYFKKLANIMKIVGYILAGIYFSCAIYFELGNNLANIILASLYLLFFIVSLSTIKVKNKKFKKIKDKSYKYIKFFIRALVIASSVYGIYESKNTNGFTVILSIFNIIWWCLQVILEILILILEPRLKLLIAGLMKDYEGINDKINKLNVILRKPTNELPLDKYSKEISILEEKVEETDKINQEKIKEYRKSHGLFKRHKKDEK